MEDYLDQKEIIAYTTDGKEALTLEDPKTTSSYQFQDPSSGI